MLSFVGVSFAAAEKTNELTKLPCLCVILFCSRRTKSDRKSEKRVEQNRSRDRGVSHGKGFWALSGASQELKVSFPYLQIAETKSACFALAGVPKGIPLGCGL